MKKLIVFLLSAMMLVTLFAGCGAVKDNSSDVKETTAAVVETKATETTAEPETKLSGKITFYTNMTTYVDTTLKNLANEFMSNNPGTEIVNESVAGDAFANKLRIVMASNELNDVTAVLADTKKTELKDYYLPLDDLGFSKDNLLFYDNGLGDDGKLYKLTSAVTYWAMVYNKKTFTDCGITSVPKTLDELYADCDKIKAKGILPITTNFKDVWPLSVIQFQTLSTNGGDYMNSLVDSDEYLTQDGIVASLKIWATLRDKGYLDSDLVSASWDACQKDMAQGKTAMTYLGSFVPKMLADQGAKDEDIGMFPFPGTKGPLADMDWFYGVAKNSQNPDLAKAYLKYMWEDARYSNAIGAVSPMKAAKVSIPAVNELLSYGDAVEHVGGTDALNAIQSKAQINLPQVFQEYLLAKNPDEIIKKYNKKWADAR